MNDLLAEIKTSLEFGLSDIEEILENFENSRKIDALLQCIDFAKRDAESLKRQYNTYKMSICPCCNRKRDKK
jgi:hypothetical protein